MRTRTFCWVNKRPGLVVHPDEQEKVDTPAHPHPGLPLSERSGTSQAGECLLPRPVQPHRIFKHGGIVIAAKNAETLRVMNQKIRDREVEKSYLCIILGAITPPAGRLGGYLPRTRPKSWSPSTKPPSPAGAPL